MQLKENSLSPAGISLAVSPFGSELKIMIIIHHIPTSLLADAPSCPPGPTRPETNNVCVNTAAVACRFNCEVKVFSSGDGAALWQVQFGPTGGTLFTFRNPAGKYTFDAAESAGEAREHNVFRWFAP